MAQELPKELDKRTTQDDVPDMETIKAIRIPAGFPLIDAHAHYGGESPAMIEWMANNNLKVVNIGGQERGETYSRLIKEYPDQYGWITSIIVPECENEDFDAAEYGQRAVAEIARDVANGAVGLKIFKSIGMMKQKADGSYLQIDDPIFAPLFTWLEENDVTHIAHVAEAMGCWQPFGEKNAYSKYYSNNPNYYMYDKPEKPHHSVIMAARDNVIARYPKMHFVGAHFGCMEYDIDEQAKRFDKYPNFAVDTSGWTRIIDLSFQDPTRVRDFFIKYQDRLMFGTDRSIKGKGHLEMSDEDVAASMWAMINAIKTGWEYYATDKTVDIKGYKIKGISLPQDVLEKLFCTNAKKWYPGL